MINLIPSEEKKIIHKVFYIRFTIVSFVVLGIAVLIGGVMLLPSFFYSSIEKNLALNQLEVQKNNPPIEFEQGAENLIKDLENKLNIINNAQKDKFLVSDKIINKINAKLIEGIKITEMNYLHDDTKGKTLEIRGFSSTRDNLLNFKNSFDRDGDFKKVDLPISNFIKSTNIQFNLILIPN
jgi:hypothetical protein